MKSFSPRNNLDYSSVPKISSEQTRFAINHAFRGILGVDLLLAALILFKETHECPMPSL